jgi:hypothetical protein
MPTITTKMTLHVKQIYICYAMEKVILAVILWSSTTVELFSVTRMCWIPVAVNACLCQWIVWWSEVIDCDSCESNTHRLTVINWAIKISCFVNYWIPVPFILNPFRLSVYLTQYQLKIMYISVCSYIGAIIKTGISLTYNVDSDILTLNSGCEDWCKTATRRTKKAIHDKIKMCIGKMSCEDGWWMQLARDCVEWQALALAMLSIKVMLTLHMQHGARGSVVGWGTVLQAGRSSVRISVRSLDF